MRWWLCLADPDGTVEGNSCATIPRVVPHRCTVRIGAQRARLVVLRRIHQEIVWGTRAHRTHRRRDLPCAGVHRDAQEQRHVPPLLRGQCAHWPETIRRPSRGSGENRPFVARRPRIRLRASVQDVRSGTSARVEQADQRQQRRWLSAPQRRKSMPVFIKYANSQYADRFLNPQEMHWYSKDRRSTASREIKWMEEGKGNEEWSENHFIPLFVMRKADAEKLKMYYYVGRVGSYSNLHETKRDNDGEYWSCGDGSAADQAFEHGTVSASDRGCVARYALGQRNAHLSEGYETISSRTATSARRGRGRSRFPSCKPGACE